MRTDWDGSSDKYARMISGWLSKLGLVEKRDKSFSVVIGGLTHNERIVEHLLLGAEYIKRGIRTLDDFKKSFANKEIEF